MDTLKSHRIWTEQCEAAHSIRGRYGVTAAFDYLVGEKLMTVAAFDYPDFARELPQFVSGVRGMFTADEIGVHLAQVERAQNEVDGAIVEEEDIFPESPAAAAARVRRFMLVKELLTAATLGTS
jgi:hypothetical protein